MVGIRATFDMSSPPVYICIWLLYTFLYLLSAFLGRMGIFNLNLSSSIPLFMFMPLPPRSLGHCRIGFLDVPFSRTYSAGLLLFLMHDVIALSAP